MANLLLPPEERRVAASKPIPPLAIDPPRLSEEDGIRPCTSLKVLHENAVRCRTLALQQGYWIHDEKFAIPQGKITDLDFVLAAITDAWLDACRERKAIPTRGFAQSLFPGVDAIRTVVPHAARSPLKKVLMGYWGQPFSPTASWPNNWHKPFLNNLRKLSRTGFLTLTQPIDGNGLMRYLVAPSQIGFIRSIWIADTTKTKDPLESIARMSDEERAGPHVGAEVDNADQADSGDSQIAEPGPKESVTRHTVVSIAIAAQARRRVPGDKPLSAAAKAASKAPSKTKGRKKPGFRRRKKA